jgi:hypothetical protein
LKVPSGDLSLPGVKRWIRTTAVAAFVLVVVLLLLGLYLGRIAKAAIETVGPHLTGTTVTVEDVEISPRIGSGTLRGLVVGNPPSYKEPYALRLGEVHVRVDLSSLRSNTVVVSSIVVTDAEVALEGAPHHNNIRKLLDTLNQRVGQDSKKPSTSKNSASERRVRVDELVISRMRVRARLNIVGIATPAAGLTLPEVRLTGLGRKGAGITIAELGRDILQAVYSEVLSAISQQSWFLKETQDGSQWLRDKTSGAIRDASKAVGDLFRKKERQQ